MMRWTLVAMLTGMLSVAVVGCGEQDTPEDEAPAPQQDTQMQIEPASDEQDATDQADTEQAEADSTPDETSHDHDHEDSHDHEDTAEQDHVEPHS